MSWLLKIKHFFSDARPALLRPVAKDLVLAIDGVENVLLMNAFEEFGLAYLQE